MPLKELSEMHFKDLCNGNLIEECDMKLKLMLKEIYHNKKTGTLTLTLKISPPTPIDGVPNLYCGVAYNATYKVPESRPVYTLLVDKSARAIKTGTSVADALNEELPLSVTDPATGEEIPLPRKYPEPKEITIG